MHQYSFDCTVGKTWCSGGGFCGLSSEVVRCWAYFSTALLSPQLHEWVYGSNLRRVWGKGWWFSPRRSKSSQLHVSPRGRYCHLWENYLRGPKAIQNSGSCISIYVRVLSYPSCHSLGSELSPAGSWLLQMLDWLALSFRSCQKAWSSRIVVREWMTFRSFGIVVLWMLPTCEAS